VISMELPIRIKTSDTLDIGLEGYWGTWIARLWTLQKFLTGTAVGDFGSTDNWANIVISNED